jgi:DNA replication protein DnaC
LQKQNNKYNTKTWEDKKVGFETAKAMTKEEMMRKYFSAPKREPVEGEYMTPEGWIYCSVCGEEKQGFHYGSWNDCVCGCHREKEREHKRRAFIRAQQEDWLAPEAYKAVSFEKDDRSQPAATSICQSYIEQWERCENGGQGLLLYGAVGTGKTFLAACTANALLAKEKSVYFANLPELIARLADFDSNEGDYILKRIRGVKLLVLDVFGAQRGSEWANEQIFRIAEMRYGKPTIVTANLTPAQMRGDSNLTCARIYDRILQFLIPVEFCGESRRRAYSYM